MSIIRQNAATRDWVIIATERAKRPHDFVHSRAVTTQLGWKEGCPFCPGNEANTPPATYSAPGLVSNADGAWQVRAFSNKYAALSGTGPAQRRLEGTLFRYMDGTGAHEVIVEHPQHDHCLALMDEIEAEAVLKAYRARYQELRSLPQVNYVIIFKNHGVGAGTSLDHPHSQVVATPVAPLQIRQRYQVATAYYDDTNRCVYCDMVAAELEIGTRVIWEDDTLVVFHPFASQSPFETWIAPKRHTASFGFATDQDLHSLARALRRTLRQLHTALNDPDFNYVVHSAPVGDEQKPYFLWHVQIVPRLTTLAGFEMGSGMHINPALPEETAAFIRGVAA